MDHDIRYLLDRGDEGDDQEALRLIDESLRLAPGNPELLVLRSEALRNLELYEEAVETARAACRARESSGATHAALGEALLEWSEEADDPQAVLAEALAALERAVAREEEASSADYWLAECLTRLGRTEEAIVRLAGVARVRGWDAACLARLERLLADGFRPSPCEERPAQYCHPDESLLLAIALRRAGDTEGARKELVTERTLDPLSREPEYQLARLAPPEEALALLAWPCSAAGFHEAWTLQGEQLAAMGRPGEARSAHERALHEGRRWVGGEELAALELCALGSPAAPCPHPTLQEEILTAMVRERRLGQAHAGATEHCGAMSQATTERWQHLGREPEVAWRIARTARAHCAPELSNEAWYAGVRQMSDSWESLTMTEQQAVSGIIVLASWLAGGPEPSGQDCAILAEASLELARHAIADARDRGRSVDELDAVVDDLAARLPGDGEPMELSAAGAIVEAVLGRPGSRGMLHALADLRPKRLT